MLFGSSDIGIISVSTTAFQSAGRCDVDMGLAFALNDVLSALLLRVQTRYFVVEVAFTAVSTAILRHRDVFVVYQVSIIVVDYWLRYG